MTEFCPYRLDPATGLTLSPERFQRSRLFAVDFKQSVEPREFQQVLHFLADLHQLQLPAPLPDDAIAAHQFSHAVAIDELHTRQIEQKFLVALARQNMDQVAELGAAVTQRESPHRVNHHDPVKLSRADVKTHGESATFCLRAESYLA